MIKFQWANPDLSTKNAGSVEYFVNSSVLVKNPSWFVCMELFILKKKLLLLVILSLRSKIAITDVVLVAILAFVLHINSHTIVKTKKTSTPEGIPFSKVHSIFFGQWIQLSWQKKFIFVLSTADISFMWQYDSVVEMCFDYMNVVFVYFDRCIWRTAYKLR